MITRTSIAAALVVAGLMAAQPAAAACALKTQPIPVKMIGQRPIVDVKVNGKTGHFLIDSGSATNQISSKFASSAKLSPVASSGGPALVTVAKFEFAGATLNNLQLISSDVLAPDVDGVIGQVILHSGDLEFDLKPFASTVKLAKAEGCEGANMAYWAKEGESFAEMPLVPFDQNAPYTRAMVTINGVQLRAMLVSGVPYSMITQKAAAKAGVKPSDPGVTPLGDKAWIAPFATVNIGGEEIKNAPLEIGATNDDFYDVLIGEDFLSAHHVYVANGQGKIYFTYAGAPGAPVFTAHPPRKAAIGMVQNGGAGIKLSGY